MIGVLTCDLEVAEKVKEKIIKLNVVKHSSYSSHVGGFRQDTYIYGSEADKDKHIADMLADGWRLVDAQSRMHIYCNFYGSDEINDSMLVPCQVFQKSIECSLK